MNLKIKNPFLWTSITTNGGIVLISILIFQDEAFIRISGMLLQLMGICSVVLGIAETRQLFGEPSFYIIAKNWFFSLIRKKNITIQLDTVHGSASVYNIRISKRDSPLGTNPTLKERVLSLEKNISFLSDDLKNLQEEIDIQGNDIQKRINDKYKLLQKEIEQINQKLKESATGGIHISALGATWLFFGVVLSSLAPELSKWLN